MPRLLPPSHAAVSRFLSAVPPSSSSSSRLAAASSPFALAARRAVSTSSTDARRPFSLEASSSSTSAQPLLSSAALQPPVKPRRASLRPKKAALTLTPSAVEQLASLSASSSSPTLLKIGLRTKGCAGMAYHLEYVDRPGRFDEVVEQDGVRVVIDSRALMGVLGSEMDWVEDRLSAKFVFHNPNIVDACGCGESFNIAASS